ncbi:tetratricopeptide repeat protein [bacterium]|nr:tetratricopeptide repeat protein [bacterium]
MKTKNIVVLMLLTFSINVFGQEAKNVEKIKQEVKTRTETLNKKIKTLSADRQTGAVTQAEYDKIVAQIEKEKEEISKLNKIVNAEGEAKRLYNSGLNLIKQKRYSEALKDLESAISIQSDFDKAYYIAGQCYGAMSDKDGALQMYNKAIQNTSEASLKAKSYYAIGNLHKSSNEDAKALENYDLAIKSASYDKAYVGKGEIYMQRGGETNIQSAISNFESALKLDPKNQLAAYNLGIANEHLNQHSKAIAAYEIASKLGKDYAADSYVGMVKAYNALGEHKKAVDVGLQALKSAPKRRKAECNCEIGEGYRKIGSQGNAIKYFEECAKDANWRSFANYGIEVTKDPSKEKKQQ